MADIKVTLVKVEGAKDLPLPKSMTSLSAGMDLAANIPDKMVLKPGEYKLVPCGIKIEFPPGCEAQVRPRSGLAVRHGVTVLNSPGTIDADYRGEIKVILINHGGKKFVINRGDRIAQLVFSRILSAEIQVADQLSETSRGSGGFGHTGI